MIDYNYHNTLAGLQIMVEKGFVSCREGKPKYFKIIKEIK